MRAILLAAGLGTRLRPLTNEVPKCLVPIKGKPLLQIWLENLTAAEFGPFLVNTHHLFKQVEAFIGSSSFCNSVTISYEPKLLGTIGTVMANIDFLGQEDVMLAHADNYCLANFEEFKLAHLTRPRDCLMTMMTFRASDPSACGVVEIDENGVLQNFFEKISNPPGNLANGAVYILSPELIQLIKERYASATDFSLDIIPNLLGKVFCFETKEVLIDIGTPERYEIATKIQS